MRTQQCSGHWVRKLPVVLVLQREPGARSLRRVSVKWEVLMETQLGMHPFCPWRVRESTRKVACVVAFEVGIYQLAPVSRSA